MYIFVMTILFVLLVCPLCFLYFYKVENIITIWVNYEH